VDSLHIPALGRSVSRLGMGSMIFSPERRELVFELLDRFAEHGGNLIDGSEVYGGGQSEIAIGMYFAERGCREDWVMLDKGCADVCLAIPNEPWWPDCTHADDEDIAWSARTGIPLLAWSSQGRGFFLDDCSPENTTNEALVRVYHNAGNFERLRRARTLAERRGVAPIQIALAYVVNLPCPTVALVGPATVGEVDSCVAASAIALSDDEMRWLNLKLSDEELAP